MKLACPPCEKKPPLGDLTTVNPGGTVQLFVQVVEPPVYVCGEQGSTFHTAAVRVKLNVNLNGLTVNVLGLSNATVALTNLTLYLEVARATGTLDLVNAVSQALTLKATPGLARLGLGQISDAVFFDRGRTAPMTLPAYAKIGAVTANLGLVLGTAFRYLAYRHWVFTGAAVGTSRAR